MDTLNNDLELHSINCSRSLARVCNYVERGSDRKSLPSYNAQWLSCDSFEMYTVKRYTRIEFSSSKDLLGAEQNYRLFVVVFGYKDYHGIAYLELN
ncbi:hypothetical protein TNCT_59311 [Trichonephila clavata]|uniref:Uncharacterized protein n=1 Tax=Trichonephila clavata TaxID=2740835 RepID=A0A8X6FHG1_TRICU|nr:hypothetical protein TNCT_59311 [Trichonephila clavata]